MIKINLLPEHMRPIRRTPLPYIASLAVLALALGGMAMAYLAVQNELGGVRSALNADKAALTALEPIVSEANELAQKKLDLESKIDVIQSILSDRIVWSEQINRLTELTPENIWFRRIAVIWELFPEQIVEVDANTGQPVIDQRTGRIRTRTVRTRKPLLQVSGYVVDDEEGRSVIFPLMEQTSNDPEFAARFTLQGPRLEDTEFGGYPVRGFTLPYLITGGGG
jgi:Tfp pilus assembly protein PilN